jgi:MarR family transcriptional regulator, lower aerobic nicotinate degradation pathway regulator
MERSGWVERGPDPADGRRKLVAITSPGRRRLHRLDTVIGEIQDELLAALTPAQRKTLVTLLTRVVSHHYED